MTDAWRSLEHTRLYGPTSRRHRAAARLVKALPFRPRFDLMEDRTLLTTFLVSNTRDNGPGSLRQAILDSDATKSGTNLIDFVIPGQGVQMIEPASPLPAITNPVLIDGFSQTGYSGTPLIELNGSDAPTGDGLTITAPNVTVRGLDVNNFRQSAGIHITGTGATGDWIFVDFLGTDPTGTQADPNHEGVEIDAGASGNLIGTNGDGVNDAAERNLISGNLFAGVWIDGPRTDGNSVAGDLIGTDITGTVALDNGYLASTNTTGIVLGGGVMIGGGASGNWIGTNGSGIDDIGERDVIEGGIGIYGTGTEGNIVAGNFIGTDVTGTKPLDGAFGLYLFDGASSNWIGKNPVGGADVKAEGNVISGNYLGGIVIGGYGGGVSNANVVSGNEIGTDATGAIAMPNSGGVQIWSGSSNNTIGGTTAAAGNLITDNVGPGVVVGYFAVNLCLGNEITANRIFGNTGQAIDLGYDGVTENASARRQGPNDLQNFPVLVTTAGRQLEGWLGGSLPDASYDIEFYASSAYNADGSGEARDYLGSMEVTTDATGQVVFTVPFTAPAGLPIVTATATDPQGNTSEVSALRQVSLTTPPLTLRIAPNQPLVFSAASGNGFAIEDQNSGPLDPVWNITLTVSVGKLTLSSTAGLTGSGDGTGSLSYSGPLLDVDAALADLTYAPPAGAHVVATLALGAQSNGASPLATQLTISDGSFVVDTTADSGPGSLRQAILDSNAFSGASNTIDFDIPGSGVRTIVLLSPLPAITTAVLVDGTSQPGYDGTPLIAFAGPQASSTPLALSNGNITIRGLAIGSLAIDPITDEDLIAVVDAPGVTSQLSLLGAAGNVLIQSEGVSSDNPDSAIDEHLAPGDYSLAVESLSGQGPYAWTTMLTPSSAPFQGATVGISPEGIAAGDFNGDGKLDLAVANEGSDDVSIVLGNGDGTFQPAVTYAVGINPGSLVAGDFTGDGKLDLVVTDSDGVQILPGNGDGTFQPARTVATGVGGATELGDSAALAAGDFTGHDELDLAVVDYGSNQVSVLLNNGDGTFQPPKQYAAGFEPDAIAVGDFTGNGHLDLAIADHGSNLVTILRGNGDGTFPTAASYAVGMDPDSVVAADFNDDGKLDLAVANTASNHNIDNPSAGQATVSVLLGDGDGTFQSAQQYPVPAYPIGLVSGDFTGDGRIDLAVADAGPSSVSVLLGNGDGTFQPEVSYPAGSSPRAMAAGDFARNGKLDLAVVSLTVPGTVTILLGNGNGTFQTPVQNPLSDPDSIVAGDFTGNGRLDLAVADAIGIQILMGNGDGTFQPAETVATGAFDFLVAGDYNGDGRLDLAVADFDSNVVSILLGNGDGTFQPARQYPAGSEPAALVAGDFNGDGKLDLAVTDYGSNEVSILLGNGDGTFQSASQYAAGSRPYAMVAGDFTGNGHLDLAVTDTGDNNVSVLLGNGDGRFQPPKEYAVGNLPYSLAAGDFNGDGKLDLAVADAGSNAVSVLAGNGDGTFQPARTVATGVGGATGLGGSAALVAGDFTGDGKLDLAVVDPGSTADGGPNLDAGSNAVSVLLGNGNGTFQPPVPYPVGEDPLSIVTGDFNGSGILGLATANASSNDVSVLLGTRDGTFTEASQVVTTSYADPVVADVSGDGTSDVFVVDGSGAILYRQGIPGQPGSFLPPVTVNPGYPSRDIVWVPITLDGPLLASVDAQDDAISLYAFRNGAFVRIGSLTSGDLPAQVIVADLDGDGLDDLVVRNAGAGTLSLFFPRTFTGPVDPQDDIPAFLPPVTLSAGLGVSDVQAVDTTGSGRLDLVVTNKLTGQVSVLLNEGNGTFAPPALYRAGTGLSEIDPAALPEVSSLDSTAGVVAGKFTTGGPTDLVAINPGSNTMDVLMGLYGGRFASPVAIDTESPAQVVRVDDFTGNGVDDLAVLTESGVSIYLGNGKGGFSAPVTYNAGINPTGLTVADVNHDGKLDLLVGDAYGDVLVLLGNGDGTFSPHHEANQAVELAVADLTGNGSKDIIYADLGLDRVVVEYGVRESTVLADQSTGLLEPGAIALADLNGDGTPDLIVANSGSNNVLIYPGLGNGQFGPAINGGNGYFVGTNPVGITVASLTGAMPDLVVADEGSNQVSLLFNQSQVGGAISFSAGPRLNSGGRGPVSTVVGNFTGGAFPDILVTNSQSHNVAILPGVGQGFFNDTDPQTYTVGTDPGPTFVGNFDGQPDLVTVNAGSNDLTLISGFNGPQAATTTISSAGLEPATAFEFRLETGFDDLVVGNGGDGVLALFEGSAEGLTLSSTETVAGLPSPSSLAFASLSGGQVQFYAATEGQEAAALVALSLGGGEISAILALASPASSGVAQLVPLQETSLALVGTLLTLTIDSSTGETESAGALALSAAPVSIGQSMASLELIDGLESDGIVPQPVAPDDPGARQIVPAAPAWQRYTLGTDEAIERFDREHPDLSPGNNDEPSKTISCDGLIETGLGPRESGDLGQNWTSADAHALQARAADRVIDLLCRHDRHNVDRTWWSDDATVWAELALAATDPISTARAKCWALLRSLAVYSHNPDVAVEDEVIPLLMHRIPNSGWAFAGRNAAKPMVAPAALILASVVTGYVYFGPATRRARETKARSISPASAL